MLARAAVEIQLWFDELDPLNRIGVCVAVVAAFYFGLLFVKTSTSSLKRWGVGGPRSRPRGPPRSAYDRYAAPPAPGPACCDKYGRRTFGGTYDQFGVPAAGHPDVDARRRDDEAYFDPPPRSRGGYGGGGGQGLGMMGLGAIMVAAWKLPPYFGHAPFFGMGPMQFMWLVQMFQGGGRRRGRGMGFGGPFGGLGGFGRRRAFF